MAKEQITLYGLPIVKERKIHFGPVDPKASRRLFILHALVRQEYAVKAPFLDHNRALFEEVRRLRDRARKSDMLADDDAIALFFEQRVPDDVYSGKTFEHWRKQAEAANPRVLCLALADVLQGEADELSPDRFPASLELCGATLPLAYRFDPGEEDDGVTLTLPLALLPQLDPRDARVDHPRLARGEDLAARPRAPQGRAQGPGPAPGPRPHARRQPAPLRRADARRR